MKLIPNFSHQDYDLPLIMAQSLDAGGHRFGAGYSDLPTTNPFYTEI